MLKYLKYNNYKNYFLKRKINNKYNFEIDWKKINYNRIAIINFLLKKFDNPSYLEIGCNKNNLFNSIYIDNKTGVDPVRGGNVRLTSDEFFRSNTKKFDLIFIDGLHEYPQVRNDFINAKKSLNDNGWILLHDMHPRNSFEEHTPRINDLWTGDCWKLAYELGLNNQYIEIIKIDFGVGVYHNDNNPLNMKEENFKKIQNYNFNFFYENYYKFNILSFSDFKNKNK